MAPGEFAATAKRRTRLVAGLLTRPGDLWLALRMVAWRLVLPALKRRMPLPRLIQLIWKQGPAEPARPEREARVADLAAMVFRSEHHYRYGNCLERSLVLCRYLSAAGSDPELLVGMRRGEKDLLEGHAWVVARGHAVGEPPNSLEGYAKVVGFRGEGSGSPVSERDISRALR
jgi:Transglutaminase-like superfamily